MKLHSSKHKIMTILFTLALPFTSLSLTSINVRAEGPVDGPGADGGAVRSSPDGDLTQIGVTQPLKDKKIILSEVPGLLELNKFFSSTSLLPKGPMELHTAALMPSGERQYYRIYDVTPHSKTIDDLKNQYSQIFNIPVDEVIISAFTLGKKTYLLPAFFDSRMTPEMQLAILFHESLWVYSEMNFIEKPTVKQVVMVETAFYNFLKTDGLHSMKFNYEFYQQLSYFHDSPYLLLYAATFDFIDRLKKNYKRPQDDLNTPTRPEDYANDLRHDFPGYYFFGKDSYQVVDPKTDWRARHIPNDPVQINIMTATSYIAGRMAHPNEQQYLSFLQALLEVLPNMSLWNTNHSLPEHMLTKEIVHNYTTKKYSLNFPSQSGGDAGGCIWVNQSMSHNTNNESKEVSFCIFATSWVVGGWENEINLDPIKDFIKK